jgi:hypothetical protein
VSAVDRFRQGFDVGGHFGDRQAGVWIEGSGATGNVVQGNFIGTNAAGTAVLRNYLGVALFGNASGNTIGGTASGARNLISGNANSGVAIGQCSNNLVQGNYIGTDVTGIVSLGNGGSGVEIAGGPGPAVGNIVGGTTVAARNLISGNTHAGVYLHNDDTSQNLIQGNYIGTNRDGNQALGNGGSGVYFRLDPASNNTIGGTDDGAGNTIAYNGGSGVAVETGINNGIHRNSIFANGGLGIDLGNNGVTPNDYQDPDEGANRLQNFPVLATAFQSGTRTFVIGMFNSTPDRCSRSNSLSARLAILRATARVSTS